MQRYNWNDVIICAGGPSFSEKQAQQVEYLRRTRCMRVVVINDSWKRVPAADMLYACDGRWWNHHILAVRANEFAGELWTGDWEASLKYVLNDGRWNAAHIEGLSLDPGVINVGGNGGYQAINLVCQFGAKTIYLVGFDMQETYGRKHWFGNHPVGLGELHSYESWIRRMNVLAEDISTKTDCTVYNCSVETALECFPRSTLSDLCFPTSIAEASRDRR